MNRAIVNTQRDYGLDFLKALMILSVIFTHSAYADSIRSSPMFPLYVDMAVPVFMVISGYVNFIRQEKHGYRTIKQLLDDTRKRTAKILIPFSICVAFEIIYNIVNKATLNEIIKLIVFAKWGNGGYYPYIIIQLIIIAPIIVCAVKKSKLCSALLLLLNVTFDFLTSEQIIPDWFHRICILRYIGFIMAGVLIAYYIKKLLKWYTVFACGVCGGLITWILNYVIQTHHIFKYWTSTSLPVVIYAAFFILCVKLISNSFIAKHMILVCKFGQSTYYVFLTQMMYYYFIKEKFFSEPNFMISILICCTIGYIWFIVDSVIINRLLGVENEKSISNRR